MVSISTRKGPERVGKEHRVLNVSQDLCLGSVNVLGLVVRIIFLLNTSSAGHGRVLVRVSLAIEFCLDFCPQARLGYVAEAAFGVDAPYELAEVLRFPTAHGEWAERGIGHRAPVGRHDGLD